ncbi:MAG: hypothetical protein HY815_23260 [Candidatus Riflebacteria bacterium]|nr:hypothetical protein [Candidatus Riflebacteria bacterium]
MTLDSASNVAGPGHVTGRTVYLDVATGIGAAATPINVNAEVLDARDTSSCGGPDCRLAAKAGLTTSDSKTTATSVFRGARPA